MLNNISRKIGFTPTEMRVILFLVIIFVLGLALKAFFSEDHKNRLFNPDYSEQDSLFSSNGIFNADSNSSISKLTHKVVDSKSEVLDFNDRAFQEKKSEKFVGEKSINLNTAEVKDLMFLQGIGEKTAASIIEYRKSIGKFSNLNQLMNVKGIGVSKFNKIKKYIYIEDK